MANIGKRFFHLINSTVVFGDCETVENSQGVVEILIKEPYTAKNGNILPYMADIMTESPKAIQIHPMNILWNVPLNEFPEANRVYEEATSVIMKPDNKIIT